MEKKFIIQYIWLDSEQKARTKSRTLYLEDGLDYTKIPIWNYDGSSTNQATTNISEVIIKPCDIFPNPLINFDSYIVLCDTYDIYGNPLSSNTRYNANKIFEQTKKKEPWFGIEQEYVIYDYKTNKPIGWPINSFPEKQGKYYCGVGPYMYGKEIAQEHYIMCLKAGVTISGINAEVMPGQWEFQIGPCTGIKAGDHMTIAKYLLDVVAEKHGCYISYKPKPEPGDWNGSGCHVNYSSKKMRLDGGYRYIQKAIQRLSLKHSLHLQNYGDNSLRLCGTHETSSKECFTSGVASRSTSVRIPYNVPTDNKGYFEDRRPASDCDPYIVTSLMTSTIHNIPFNPDQ